MIVIKTEHFVNKTVTDCFAHGIKAEKVNIKDYQKEYLLMIKLLKALLIQLILLE